MKVLLRRGGAHRVEDGSAGRQVAGRRRASEEDPSLADLSELVASRLVSQGRGAAEMTKPWRRNSSSWIGSCVDRGND
jgi:hypothetical protein